MKRCPLYTNHQIPSLKPENAHSGLWFDRFFYGYTNNWEIPKPDKEKEIDVKRDWINQVTGYYQLNYPIQRQLEELENFVSDQKHNIDRKNQDLQKRLITFSRNQKSLILGGLSVENKQKSELNNFKSQWQEFISKLKNLDFMQDSLNKLVTEQYELLTILRANKQQIDREKNTLMTKLDAFNHRQLALVNMINGDSHRFQSDWNFVTGMGNAHPVENGFSWHPTLAVPYLSGASVKGLVRAWVELNDEQLDEQEKNKRLFRWFGTADKGDIAEQTGEFIFFDALPDKPPQLVCDIMTPHMGKWYSEGENARRDKPDTLPADWHEPVPIAFLAVKKTNLIFHIAPRNGKETVELEDIFKALTQALEYLGAGAKTAAGYGYFTQDRSFADHLQAIKDERRKEIDEQQHWASLSPVEKDVEDFLRAFQESEHDTRLLSELKTGRWQEGDAKQVAQRIKEIMLVKKKWMPDFAGTNSKKVKLKDRSLYVQGFLEN